MQADDKTAAAHTEAALLQSLVKSLSAPLTNAGVAAAGNAADALIDIARGCAKPMPVWLTVQPLHFSSWQRG